MCLGIQFFLFILVGICIVFLVFQSKFFICFENSQLLSLSILFLLFVCVCVCSFTEINFFMYMVNFDYVIFFSPDLVCESPQDLNWRCFPQETI